MVGYNIYIIWIISFINHLSAIAVKEDNLLIGQELLLCVLCKYLKNTVAYRM